MSESLQELQIVRGGVMTAEPPTPSARIARCTVFGDNGARIDLPIGGIEYAHYAQIGGTVKLLIPAHYVVFPVEGRDADAER